MVELREFGTVVRSTAMSVQQMAATWDFLMVDWMGDKKVVVRVD